MPRRPIAIGVLALSLLAARPAHADSFIDYSSQCFTGSFWTCASVQVFTRPTPTGTYVEIRMRNLMPGNARISSLLMWERGAGRWGGYNPWETLAWGPVGNVDVVGPQPGFAWDFSNGFVHWGDTGNPYSGFQGYAVNGGGIVGCDNTEPIPDYWDGTPTGFWRTCPSQGFDGWVGFRFTIGKHITASDVVIYDVGGHDYRTQAVSVTPEPGTMVLLATGLAGVAGLRRRKRKNTFGTTP
jgi:PEP-CTERM motif